MTQDQWMNEAMRRAHCLMAAVDETGTQYSTAAGAAYDYLLCHLQQRPLPVSEEGVLVLLKRPEGYEDVHPELLVADAGINPAFEPEIVSRPLPVRDGAEIHRLQEALRSAQRAINSMKVEAETGAAIGDEDGMLDACNTISREGLEADTEIRAVLDGAGEADSLIVKWTGADGATHEISIDYAAQIAKWMFDKHGDVDQVDAAIARDRASSPSVQSMGEGETGKDGVEDVPHG